MGQILGNDGIVAIRLAFCCSHIDAYNTHLFRYLARSCCLFLAYEQSPNTFESKHPTITEPYNVRCLCHAIYTYVLTIRIEMFFVKSLNVKRQYYACSVVHFFV